MTPAEQYRNLANRLQTIAEDQTQATTDPNIGQPGYRPEYPPLTSTPPRDYAIPPAVNRYPPKALGVPITQFQQQLQTHCLGIIKQMSQFVPIVQRQILNSIKVQISTDPDASAQAQSSRGIVEIDYNQLGDAPDDVIKFLLAHEVGHIVMGHGRAFTGPVTHAEHRQQEMDADSYAIRMCQLMGVTRAPVFLWLYRKKDALGKTEYQDYLDWDTANPPDPEATHPTYPQRIDNASRQGFELGKANTDQIDRLLAHMSRLA